MMNLANIHPNIAFQLSSFPLFVFNRPIESALNKDFLVRYKNNAQVPVQRHKRQASAKEDHRSQYNSKT